MPRASEIPQLSASEFLDAVTLTPLISIDLIATNPAGRVLLGLRRNRPALHKWFVPGGRIRKNERLDEAFTRIVETELGIAGMERSAARFGGVFEHFYDDNFAHAPGVATHYVVLAYAMILEDMVSIGRYEQHSRYAWFSAAELLSRDDVHEFTKAYFR